MTKPTPTEVVPTPKRYLVNLVIDGCEHHNISVALASDYDALRTQLEETQAKLRECEQSRNASARRDTTYDD